MLENVQRLASFAHGGIGGNPAGVWIGDKLPDTAQMLSIAAQVGYSETAFAMPQGDKWRVRYFAPQMEVPFCGHATIALGAALAARAGDGVFTLALNEAEISVEGRSTDQGQWASLVSPPTKSRQASTEVLGDVLSLFGLTRDDLFDGIHPGEAHAGADHFVLPLNSRETLSQMSYDFDAGAALMNRHGWITIALVVPETQRLFHVRNAFAAGGVVEDPATGAAAAALSGLLRDQGWSAGVPGAPGDAGGELEIHQGDDMGMPSRIQTAFGPTAGEPVRVSGQVRAL